MDAPTYPPATAYAPPELLPFDISVRELPLAPLMAMPAVWAIVIKHVPGLQLATGSSMIKPHLNNMGLPDLLQFMGPAQPDVLDVIDAEIRALPAADRVVP